MLRGDRGMVGWGWRERVPLPLYRDIRWLRHVSRNPLGGAGQKILAGKSGALFLRNDEGAANETRKQEGFGRSVARKPVR